MPAITRACDVGVAVLQNITTFRTVYPNKIFDYMACARPVLLGIDGAVRKLVCDVAGAGVFVEPENASELATAIRRLRDRPEERRELGVQGYRWVQQNACRDVLAKRYLDVLLDLAGEKSRPAPTAVRRKVLTLKDMFDWIVAFSLLVLLTPLFALVAIVVWLTIGRPVFFLQERPGLRGRPFRLMKFRTMKLGEGPDSERLTRVGAFLRSTSLDELPELWNVLRGEMSLVGPRPLLMKYLDRYSPEQARRHEVNPGITGWAQIHGRNAISWDDKFRYDVWYVDHTSFMLDLRILLVTIAQVLFRRGVNAPGVATASEFMGPSRDGAHR
jgi:lipopolysaccharide/colanic/teichoic acid biosynthesis glycosyltransferase